MPPTHLSFKKEVSGTLEGVIEKITELLKKEGFGILTRIDFHSKMKEKLGKDIPPAVILGACNPQFAFEAYQKTTDVLALIPCNAVVRQISDNKMSVELTAPSAMLEILGGKNLGEMAVMAGQVDERLRSALSSL